MDLVQSSSDDSGEGKVRPRATSVAAAAPARLVTPANRPSIPPLRLLPQGNGAAHVSVVEKDGVVPGDGFNAGKIHHSAAP